MTVSSHPLVAKFEGELTSRRSSLGNDHIDVVETLNALALANHHMADNQDEALRCHKEALHIFGLRKGGPDYPLADVALTLSDIGNVHRKRGKYNAAATCYMESVQTYRLCGFRDNHPRVQSVLKWLAQLEGILSETEEEHRESEPYHEHDSSTKMEKQNHLSLSKSPAVLPTFSKPLFLESEAPSPCLEKSCTGLGKIGKSVCMENTDTMGVDRIDRS